MLFNTHHSVAEKNNNNETTTMERNMKLFRISGFCVNQRDQQKNE